MKNQTIILLIEGMINILTSSVIFFVFLLGHYSCSNSSSNPDENPYDIAGHWKGKVDTQNYKFVNDSIIVLNFEQSGEDLSGLIDLKAYDLVKQATKGNVEGKHVTFSTTDNEFKFGGTVINDSLITGEFEYLLSHEKGTWTINRDNPRYIDYPTGYPLALGQAWIYKIKTYMENFVGFDYDTLHIFGMYNNQYYKIRWFKSNYYQLINYSQGKLLCYGSVIFDENGDSTLTLFSKPFIWMIYDDEGKINLSNYSAYYVYNLDSIIVTKENCYYDNAYYSEIVTKFYEEFDPYFNDGNYNPQSADAAFYFYHCNNKGIFYIEIYSYWDGDLAQEYFLKDIIMIDQPKNKLRHSCLKKVFDQQVISRGIMHK